jgi:hypothetical protein
MRYHLACLLTVLSLAAVLPAQSDGDAVLTLWSNPNTHILAVAPNGVVQTILTRANTGSPDGLAAAPANDGALMVEASQSPGGLRVVAFKNGSSVTTLASLPNTFLRAPTLLVDSGGDILLLNLSGNDRGVYRMPGGGGPLMTVAHNNVNATFTSPFAMTEEIVSGDLLVLDSGRKLHRIDRAGTVTTVTMILPPSLALAVTGNVHVDHGTGLLHLTYGQYFLGLDPNTAAVTTIYGPSTTGRASYYGLDGDPFGGGYYLTVNRATPTPAGRYLFRYSPRSGTLSTVGTLPNGTFSDVMTWRSRMLGGLTRPARGTAYRVRLSIPVEAGKAYFAAAALGILPGIPVGGKHVPLNPDALFFLSIQVPTIFSGFQGVLSNAGTADLTVNIPPVQQLLGFRFFLAAITFDGGGIRAVSEPLGVTIE